MNWMFLRMDANWHLRSESVSEREEKIGEFEIYTVELANATVDRPPRQITHNEAQEQDLRWAKDSKHIFFEVQYGSVEGKYKDRQTRLYWVDAETGEIQRWAADFEGAVGRYTITPDGGVVAAGQLGTRDADVFPVQGFRAFFQTGWRAGHIRVGCL